MLRAVRRRVGYIAIAIVLAIAYYGSQALQGGDNFSPFLFGMASGLCIAAAIRPESHTIWFLSGLTTFVAFLWRLGQVVAASAGWINTEAPDALALASAAYMFCLLGTLSLWRHRLRPVGNECP